MPPPSRGPSSAGRARGRAKCGRGRDADHEATTMQIGYLVGSDSHGRIERDGRDIDTKGNTDLFLLRSRDPRGYGRIHIVPGYFRQQFRYDLAGFDLLLNLVTDADQNPKVLA